jgi:hypothetical protein
MKKSLGLIAIIITLIAALECAKADDLKCSMPMPETMRVELTRTPTRFSADLSLTELRQAAIEHHHLGPIVGANRATISYAVDIDHATQKIGPGRFCATPKYIILRVTLDQTIFIPRDFVGDNCLASLARNHEGKHAASEDSAVDRVQSAFLSVLRSAVRHNPTEPKPSAAEALSDFGKEMKSAVEQVLDQVDRERARLNASVDTPAEIEQLTRACGGRAVQR